MANIKFIHKKQTYNIAEQHIKCGRVNYCFDVYCTGSTSTELRTQLADYSNDESLILHDSSKCSTGKLKYVYMIEEELNVEFVFYTNTYDFGNVKSFIYDKIHCIRIMINKPKSNDKNIVLYLYPCFDMDTMQDYFSSYMYFTVKMSKPEWTYIYEMLSSYSGFIQVDYFGK